MQNNPTQNRPSVQNIPSTSSSEDIEEHSWSPLDLQAATTWSPPPKVLQKIK